MSSEQIRITISERDMALIRATCKKAGSDEVGGLGTILYTASGTPYIGNIYIPPQKVSHGGVEWGEAGLTSYLEWLYKSKSEGGAGYDEDELYLYSFHSHNYMDVFWSATDEEFIEIIRDSGAKYLVSSVFNNKGEAKHRLDIFYDVKGDCPLVDIDQRSQITYEDDDEVVLEIISPKIIREKTISINALKSQLDQEIEALNKKYKEAVAPLDKEIAHARKEIENSVTKEIESYWDERVDSSSKRFITGPYGSLYDFDNYGETFINWTHHSRKNPSKKSSKVTTQNHVAVCYRNEEHVLENLGEMVLVDDLIKDVTYFTTVRYFLQNTDCLDLNAEFDYGYLSSMADEIREETMPIEDQIENQMIGWEGHV